MNKGLTIKKIAFWASLLVIGKLFSEAHSFILLCSKDLGKWPGVKLNLFISKECDPVDVLWYFKMIGDDIDKIMDGFVASLMAKAFEPYVQQLSRTLYKIIWVFIFYRIADLLLFMYNFNLTPAIYWVMIGCAIFSTRYIIQHRNKLVAV